MKMYKGLFIRLVINAFGIYAILENNHVMLNIFTAGTSLFFAFTILSVLSIMLLHDNPDVRKSLFLISKREPLPFAIKWFDRLCDILLVCSLFGYGHWWKGFAWLFIHFVFYAIIKTYADNVVSTQNT